MRPPFRTLLKHYAFLLSQWLHSIVGPQALLVSFFGEAPLSSPHYSCPVLLAMVGHCPNTADMEFRVSEGKILMAPQIIRQVLLRLTPCPGASLPLDLTDNPRAAHSPASNCAGYVVMYTANRTMTFQDKTDNYQSVGTL